MLPIFRRQASSVRQSSIASQSVVYSRYLHQTSIRSFPRKDAQDKDSISTEPTEYSKSGSDYAAAHEDAAFSRDKTRPEEQQAAEKSEPQSSLNASPANSHLGTKPKDAHKDDAGASPSESKSSQGSRARSSGEDSPNKQGKGPGKGV